MWPLNDILNKKEELVLGKESLIGRDLEYWDTETEYGSSKKLAVFCRGPIEKIEECGRGEYENYIFWLSWEARKREVNDNWELNRDTNEVSTKHFSAFIDTAKIGDKIVLVDSFSSTFAIICGNGDNLEKPQL